MATAPKKTPAGKRPAAKGRSSSSRKKAAPLGNASAREGAKGPARA